MRLLLAGLLALAPAAALGHSLYTDFYSSGEKGVGRWCCSGNEEGTSGDCAPATYTMLPNGDAMMESRRYPGKHIRVAKDRILWMVLPGGEQYEAHYCGIPRTPAMGPPTADDPDPEFVTFCVAIAPGGV